MEKRKRPRTCVGCGVENPKREMLRIVRSPDDGSVCYDSRGKMPGRGAYICKNLSCILEAKKRKGLQRALKTSVSPELYGDLLEQVSADESPGDK